MKKFHIAALLALAVTLIFMVIHHQANGEISCRVLASYDAQGRYLLIDPEGVVSIKELRIKNEVFSSGEEKDTFLLRYPWVPGERIKIHAKTSKGECTVEVEAPELERGVRLTIENLPGVIVVHVDSTGLTTDVKLLGRVRSAEFLEGSIFTDSSFVSSVRKEVADVLRSLDAGSNQKVCLAIGGIVDDEHMKTCREIVYFGAHPPGKYYINPSGGVSFREVKGYAEAESTCTFRGERVTSLWYPVEQVDVLAWREDGRPCAYKKGKVIAFTFPVDQLSSPRKAASLLLDYVLGGESLYQGKDEYVQAEIAKELPAGNYSIVVLGYLGRYLEQVNVEHVTVPEPEAVLDLRREGEDIIVGVAGSSGVLSIREINGKERRSYSVESGKLYRIPLHSGVWLLTLNKGNRTVAARVLEIPSYSIEMEGEQAVLLADDIPFSGPIEVLTAEGWQRVELAGGVLPEDARKVRIEGVELVVPKKKFKIKAGDIIVVLVIILALASGLLKQKEKNEIFIIFPEATEVAEPEKENVVSAEEIEDAMKRYSAFLGYDMIPLTAEEVRAALTKYAPSVNVMPSLFDVENLLGEMCSSGRMLSEAGYYAPASWCRDQSIRHLVMCRLAYERLILRGVEAEITTRKQERVSERRIVRTPEGVKVEELCTRRKASIPDVMGKKGEMIYLVECETGNSEHALSKLKRLVFRALGFPANYILWVVGTPELIERLREDEEALPAIEELEKQGRLELLTYVEGKLL